VVKNEKINEIERTRVRSPPRATSFYKKNFTTIYFFLYDYRKVAKGIRHHYHHPTTLSLEHPYLSPILTTYLYTPLLVKPIPLLSGPADTGMDRHNQYDVPRQQSGNVS
jgi:hypothetical protein